MDAPMGSTNPQGFLVCGSTQNMQL